MIVVIAARDRKKPVGTVAPPDEAEALLTSMIAYSGTYTIDSAAKKVSIHVDVSWEQSRVGTVQVRSYKLEGGHLLLTTEPSTDPATGEKTVRTLVWER
jgi:Lipocalin-like domain